jgi:hypothetical protein
VQQEPSSVLEAHAILLFAPSCLEFCDPLRDDTFEENIDGFGYIGQSISPDACRRCP